MVFVSIITMLIVSLFSESHDPMKIDSFSHAACSFEINSPDTQDIHRGTNTSSSASDSRELSLAYGLCSNFNNSDNINIVTTSTFDRDRTDLILQLLRLDSLNSEEKDSLISLIKTILIDFIFYSIN